MNELDLLTANGYHLAPCACGGLVIARDRAPNSIVTAVYTHNQTAQHQGWRARHDRQEEGTRGVVGGAGGR